MFLNHMQCSAVAFTAAEYKKVPCVVLMLCKECLAGVAKLNLPASIADLVAAYTARHQEIFSVGALHTLTVMQGDLLQEIVLVGCGEGKACTPTNMRKAAGTLARHLHDQKLAAATIAVPLLQDPKKGHYLQALVEGLYLGAYTFTECKGNPQPPTDCTVAITAAAADKEALVAEAAVEADAVSLVRNLVNRPANIVTPAVMAQEAAKVAEEFGLEIEVLEEKDMERLGMGAILAVGRGSVQKPKMITLKYNGAGDAPYTAYVGKGITFDTGGISIKPDDNMGEMKDDMTGAANVLAAIKAIAALKLPCNVMSIMACAENMPDADAYRPGDVVKAANGKTIEVISCDAEGRLVLADGVCHACALGAKRVIDIATLTGGVMVALGTETSGIITNKDSLAEDLKAAGKKAGEPLWQLPSLPDLKEAIKSDVADVLNSAGRYGSCITGGLFVGEFIAEGVEWAHIDIGGTSTATKTSGYKVKGGTGFGALTLIKYAGTL